MTWVIIGVVAAILLLVVRKRRARNPAPEDASPSVEQEIRHAIRTLEEPREIYEGRWFKHVVKMVECDPPAHALRARQPPPVIVEPMQRRAR